ncbi:MAG: DUF2505 domain-containing protein [Proteobacteria bacterium]|nr:DUF2505 domain-containing protein [Pseudomonadota bacterium]
MQRISATHELPCSPERFWEIYHSEELREAQTKVQRLREYTLVKSDDHDDRTVHVYRIHPDRDMPSAVRRVIPSATAAFIEERIFYKKDRYIQWNVTPLALPDRAQCTGTLKVTATATGCRRIIDGSIKISVFGVGGLIERAVGKNVQDGFDCSADLFRKLA